MVNLIQAYSYRFCIAVSPAVVTSSPGAPPRGPGCGRRHRSAALRAAASPTSPGTAGSAQCVPPSCSSSPELSSAPQRSRGSHRRAHPPAPPPCSIGAPLLREAATAIPPPSPAPIPPQSGFAARPHSPPPSIKPQPPLRRNTLPLRYLHFCSKLCLQ